MHARGEVRASYVRMLVRGHVERGEERQADDVGDGAHQLGAARGSAAAAGLAAPAAAYRRSSGNTQH